MAGRYTLDIPMPAEVALLPEAIPKDFYTGGDTPRTWIVAGSRRDSAMGPGNEGKGTV